jgi:hypothetical protein
MQLCLRAQAALLGSLGLFVVVLTLGTSIQSDKWFYVMAFSTALLLPPVLYLLLLPRYLRDDTEGRGFSRLAVARPRAFPLVLSVALYLPLMILLSSDTKKWGSPLGPIPLFLVLWLFCAYAYQWLRGNRSPAPAENIRSPRDLDDWLKTTSRFLCSPVVLLLGAVLLARSLWVEKVVFDLLKGHQTWITAEYGLGDQIPAARLLLNYLGWFDYGGSLLLAACTVLLLLVCRFSRARLRASRAASVLGLVAGFLAIYSITDYYFSWLSFLLGGNLSAMNWILFILLFLHWLVPLLFAVAVIRTPRKATEAVRLELRTIVVFYVPLLLFDLAMTPFFEGDLGSLFVLDTFLGLQFLAWGYLQLADSALPEPLVR